MTSEEDDSKSVLRAVESGAMSLSEPLMVSTALTELWLGSDFFFLFDETMV